MNMGPLGSSKSHGFLDQLRTIIFSRRTLLHEISFLIISLLLNSSEIFLFKVNPEILNPLQNLLGSLAGDSLKAMSHVYSNIGQRNRGKGGHRPSFVP
jgi:hypothetical protein